MYIERKNSRNRKSEGQAGRYMYVCMKARREYRPWVLPSPPRPRYVQVVLRQTEMFVEQVADAAVRVVGVSCVSNCCADRPSW